jgi:hypothetical protein
MDPYLKWYLKHSKLPYGDNQRASKAAWVNKEVLVLVSSPKLSTIVRRDTTTKTPLDIYAG